jgi:membrane associated rhomboid family serine protease
VKNYLVKQIYSTLFFPLLFVLFIWIVFWMQNTIEYNFLKFGVLPRESAGLLGIITSVFIHGDIHHILSNTLPLLVLGMLLFYFYKKIAIPVFLWIWLVSGIWLWIGGRNNLNYHTCHIGASTLVYGLASFLFFSGVFRKHIRLMVVSMLVVFLYGGIVWGVFPLKEEMSWEGHLFGAIAGMMIAFNYRKEGPQRRIYKWEEEEEDEGEPQPWQETGSAENTQVQNSSDEIKITYIYKEKEKEN